MKAVLTIAGSDSSGGAGIQADIKTIAAYRLFAECAITALTAQNTTGVYGVQDVDPAFVEQQIDVVFDDIRPAAVKIGMVSSADIARTIADTLSRNTAENIVVDPVMVATSGSALIATDAIDALVRHVFPLAAVITPNVPEAAVLAEMAIETEADMETAAAEIGRRVREEAGRTPCIVLKGGHGVGDANQANDLLYVPNGSAVWLEGPRIDNPNTHGTGCSLSSAIACGLALGRTVEQSVRNAKEYVAGALSAKLDMGRGSGPLDHMWEYR